MNLVSYNPRFRSLGLLNRLLDDEFDSLLEREPQAAAEWLPAVDISERPDSYVLRADLPGVNAEDIDISMEKGVLTIQGSREREKHEDHQGYQRSERVTGRFLRRFTLPETADGDDIEAVAKNGVLEIRIPKQPQLQPRKIDVKSA